ncbi:MAG: DUF6542 domain-containing protein [Candidatus Nanopelagicales bacterium]
MSESAASTGRLFRSLRAEGDAADAAVPALTLDQAVGLRTVTLGGSSSPVSPSTSGPPVTVTPAAAAAATPSAPSPVPLASVDHDPSLEYAEVAPRPDPTDTPIESDGAQGLPAGRRAHAAPGMRASGVWLVVIGVTVVMGFADALVVGRTQLGWLTGVSLLAASIYGALVVRRQDAIIAVIAPPLAFFVATITAGQLTLPTTGGLLVQEAFMIVSTLGANAAWVFGSTIVALVIVLVRRRRSAPSSEG